MKRTLALLLLVSLLATPALAQVQESAKDGVVVGNESVKAETLREAVVEVSREIVAEEASTLEAGAVVQRGERSSASP